MNFYELLEISPAAGTQDVHRAYDRVRRIYDLNPLRSFPLSPRGDRSDPPAHRRCSSHARLRRKPQRVQQDAKERNECRSPSGPHPNAGPCWPRLRRSSACPVLTALNTVRPRRRPSHRMI